VPFYSPDTGELHMLPVEGPVCIAWFDLGTGVSHYPEAWRYEWDGQAFKRTGDKPHHVFDRTDYRQRAPIGIINEATGAKAVWSDGAMPKGWRVALSHYE
jgi:hypothetical protein